MPTLNSSFQIQFQPDYCFVETCENIKHIMQAKSVVPLDTTQYLSTAKAHGNRKGGKGIVCLS